MEAAIVMSDRSQDAAAMPMFKEETVKDDGRTLIYYSFPDDPDVPAPGASLPEDAHV
jgi:hypothetical protein